MKSLKYTTALVAAVTLVMAVEVNAGEKAASNPYLGTLSQTTSAELSTKAAELVAQAEAANLKQTTIAVVKAAVGLNPAAAPAIVGSIAQSTPAMAGIAAATAVALVPNQAVAIARAAAAAAPNMAGSIVEAICRVSPSAYTSAAYQKIACAVADVVPGAGKEILAGIVAAIPDLKNVMNQVLASYDGKIPSVSTVLAQVAKNQNLANTTAFAMGNPALIGSSSSSAAAGVVPAVIGAATPSPFPSVVRGPTSGDPLVPITTPTTPTDPGTGGQVPEGSRGYAAP